MGLSESSSLQTKKDVEELLDSLPPFNLFPARGLQNVYHKPTDPRASARNILFQTCDSGLYISDTMKFEKERDMHHPIVKGINDKS